MRAVEVQDGWGLDHVQIVDREVPSPGPGEVLVRLHAASINFRDWLMLQGRYNPRQRLPLVLGSDGAGVVEECGQGVTRFAAGDRVIPHFFRDWIAGQPTASELRTSLGGPLDGTLQEYFCAPEHAFVRTPEHLSDFEAATLPCAALTAWSALVSQGGLRAGQTVLVLGTGGVSMFALQFAQMSGAHVIATSSSDEKLAILRDRFGVTDTLNYRTDPEWGRAARRLSGGGVDHVVEVGGAGTLQRSIQAVKPGGIIHLIGVLAGASEQLDLTGVLMRNVRIQGVIVGPRQDFEEMNRAISANALHPLVDTTFALDDVSTAFEHLRDQKHMGKVVVEL